MHTKTWYTRTIATAGGVTLAMAASATTAAAANEEVPEPDKFTSAFVVDATPDMIVDPDTGESVPGEEGARGDFEYWINSHEEIICYDLTLTGVTPPYESPALTATHIHEGSAGEPGPPRLAFPDPTDHADGTLTSQGCMQGPFETGVDDEETGNDTGEGFSLSEIEENPSGFFGDNHTEQFVAGAVRGQLREMPLGGVDTGSGPVATGGSSGTGVGGAEVALGAVGAAGVLGLAGYGLVRRRQPQS